jgi:site-specific DNA-adenine methylase
LLDPFLINDLNKPLINLLKLVIEYPEYTSKNIRKFGLSKNMTVLNVIIKLEKDEILLKNNGKFY